MEFLHGSTGFVFADHLDVANRRSAWTAREDPGGQ
jgi:hypothetical protein